MKILIAIVLLLAGVLWCLFGYRLFRPLSAVIGLITCGTAGYCIADYYHLQTVVVLLIAAAAGLIGGGIGFWLVKVHAMITGLLCGILTTISIVALVIGGDFLSGLAVVEEHLLLYSIIALLAGILLAILCVVFFKPAILLLSSITGALLLTNQITSFIKMEATYSYILLAVSALIGIIVQIITTGGLIHDKKDRKETETKNPENEPAESQATDSGMPDGTTNQTDLMNPEESVTPDGSANPEEP